MRIQRERSHVWYSAMMPTLKKPPTFAEFVGKEPDRGSAKQRCLEAWDKVDRALARNRKR